MDDRPVRDFYVAQLVIAVRLSFLFRIHFHVVLVELQQFVLFLFLLIRSSIGYQTSHGGHVPLECYCPSLNLAYLVPNTNTLAHCRIPKNPSIATSIQLEE